MSDFIRILDKLQRSQDDCSKGLFEAIRDGYRVITESEDADPVNLMDDVEMDIADSSFGSDDCMIDTYFYGGPFDACEVDYNFRFYYSADITRSYNSGTDVVYGSTVVQYEPAGYEVEYNNESLVLEEITDADGRPVSTEDCVASLGITVDELNGIMAKFEPKLISYAEEGLGDSSDDGPEWDGQDDW